MTGAPDAPLLPKPRASWRDGWAVYLQRRVLIVLLLGFSSGLPLALSGSTLLTREWTPLEPGALDHKVYKRGVGTVREESVKGPIERLVLVSFKGGA